LTVQQVEQILSRATFDELAGIRSLLDRLGYSKPVPVITSGLLVTSLPNTLLDPTVLGTVFQTPFADQFGRVLAALPPETLNGFSRPAAATVATASIAAQNPIVTLRVVAQFILCAVNVQAAILAKVSDGALVSYWESNVIAAAGTMVVVTTPPLAPAAAVGLQLNAIFAAPAAGNFVASFISGYPVAQ